MTDDMRTKEQNILRMLAARNFIYEPLHLTPIEGRASAAFRGTPKPFFSTCGAVP